MFRKIWKDPVWSKVISGFILFISGSIWALVKANLDEITFWVSLKEIFSSFIFWGILAILIVLYILYKIYRKKEFAYDSVALEQDKNLLDKIRNEYLSDEFWRFFNTYDFGSSFLREELKPLMDFEDIKNNPDYIFNNPELEEIKKELLQNVALFKDMVAFNTTANEHGVLIVLSAIRDNPDKHEKFKTKIHGYANDICKNYNNLVKAMRLQRVTK